MPRFFFTKARARLGLDDFRLDPSLGSIVKKIDERNWSKTFPVLHQWIHNSFKFTLIRIFFEKKTDESFSQLILSLILFIIVSNSWSAEECLCSPRCFTNWILWIIKKKGGLSCCILPKNEFWKFEVILMMIYVALLCKLRPARPFLL